MITLRSFRNTDTSSLCAIWNEHHADLGLECEIDPLRFELFSLAKPYFEPENLLIAEDQTGRIQGFLHFGPISNDDLSNTAMDEIAVFALCVRPDPDEDRVAKELLQRVCETARKLGSRICTFRPMLPNAAFYLSLGPADCMAGVISQEVRLCKWLSQCEFSPQTPTCLWELELMAFQAPIDRIQIQIRRAATVHQQLDEPELPWWLACALGHTEPTKFQLTHRQEKRTLCEALFWTLSPELQSSPAQIVWLWPPNQCTSPPEQDYQVFLLSEALRQYQEERVDYVRTAALADDSMLTALFRRLGFRVIHNGMVFQKQLL